MKIKWNWGTGIFIALIAMMAFVFFLVSKTFEYKINKVSDDYYERGLNHSEQMKRTENSRKFADEFDVVYTSNCLVQFPSFFQGKDLSGKILFFRPSDYSYDKEFDIDLNQSAQQIFSLDQFIKGRYIVKVTCESQGQNYYFEKEIIFN